MHYQVASSAEVHYPKYLSVPTLTYRQRTLSPLYLSGLGLSFLPIRTSPRLLVCARTNEFRTAGCGKCSVGSTAWLSALEFASTFTSSF